MATQIRMKHSKIGLIRNGYYGFSWTYLFFGWFVPLFRGEMAVAAFHVFFTVITLGLWQLVFCFLYNRQFMSRQLLDGWELSDSSENNEKAKLALDISD